MADQRVFYIVGYWKWVHRNPLPTDQWPDPRHPSLIDPAWFGDDRTHVIDYLKVAEAYLVEMGYSTCRFDCGIEDHKMGCRELTDGVWCWPEGLHHYIEEHDVILPKIFVEHMRQNRFSPPKRQEHWPEGSGHKSIYDSSLWIDWYHRRIAS